MNTNKTNNKGGAKEVATPKTNNTNTNNKTKETKPTKTAIMPTPKEEEKETPKQQPQPKTLEQQINHFLGLEKLVNTRRKFETHLKKVKTITIDDEDLQKFETGNNYGIRIELHDDNRNEYNITNPRLVKEMQEHLVKLITNKLEEYDHLILTYGEPQEEQA